MSATLTIKKQRDLKTRDQLIPGHIYRGVGGSIEGHIILAVNPRYSDGRPAFQRHCLSMSIPNYDGTLSWEPWVPDAGTQFEYIGEMGVEVMA